MKHKVTVAQFGLGPIGQETIKLAASKPWARVVGAVDNDPAKAGEDLGKLCGVRSLRDIQVYSAFEQLPLRAHLDVVIHTATSKFTTAFQQLEAMVRAGVNVVSSCEELVFPQLADAKLAKELDGICKRSGARIVAAGVNPGFVMDLLPLCLSGVCMDVQSIRIERLVNASTRREPLQRKIGSGQEVRAFAKQLAIGAAGHAGLRQSLALLAHGLGWNLQKITESAKPVTAERPITTEYFQVKSGFVCGIHQHVAARFSGQRRLELDIRMQLDAEHPYDLIVIEGNPPLSVRVEGGIAGDQATAASLVNTVPKLMGAEPGLRLLTELQLPRIT